MPPVDLAAALHYVDGDRALLGELFGIFQAEHRARLGSLRRAIATGDRPEAERLAHNLKGVLGVLGAVHGQGLAEELEAAVRQGRSDLEPLLGRLEAAVEQVVAYYDRGEWRRPP